MTGGGVINVSSKREFDGYCGSISGKPAVVDFSAAWCGPCKMMAPVFEKLSAKYSASIAFLKVDIDSNQDIAREYAVSSVPTFIVFHKGQSREQILGANVNALEALLEKYKGFHSTFQGTGHKLSGAPASEVTRESSAAAQACQLDPSKPHTSLQIRMADGQRVLAKLNTTTTIGELRSHIRSLNPGGPSQFSLLTGAPAPHPIGFPEDMTLQSAGLLDSVVIQRA